MIDIIHGLKDRKMYVKKEIQEERKLPSVKDWTVMGVLRKIIQYSIDFEDSQELNVLNIS